MTPDQVRGRLPDRAGGRRGANDRAGDGPIDRTRIERGLDTLAAIIAIHGPRYAPIYERLEREYATLAARDDVAARALARAERIAGEIAAAREAAREAPATGRARAAATDPPPSRGQACRGRLRPGTERAGSPPGS